MASVLWDDPSYTWDDPLSTWDGTGSGGGDPSSYVYLVTFRSDLRATFDNDRRETFSSSRLLTLRER
jgi:hypothetical protein